MQRKKKTIFFFYLWFLWINLSNAPNLTDNIAIFQSCLLPKMRLSVVLEGRYTSYQCFKITTLCWPQSAAQLIWNYFECLLFWQKNFMNINQLLKKLNLYERNVKVCFSNFRSVKNNFGTYMNLIKWMKSCRVYIALGKYIINERKKSICLDPNA